MGQKKLGHLPGSAAAVKTRERASGAGVGAATVAGAAEAGSAALRGVNDPTKTSRARAAAVQNDFIEELLSAVIQQSIDCTKDGTLLSSACD